MNILIVETHEQYAKKMKKCLKNFDFEIGCSLTIKDFLNSIKNKKPNLLIVDLSLIEFLNNMNEKIPFITTSTVENNCFAGKMIKLGSKYHLIKDKYFLKNLPEVVGNVLNSISTENSLIERKLLLNQLADNTSVAIFLFQNNKFILVNKTTEKLTGYSRDELTSMNFWDVVHPDSRELVRKRGIARQKGEKITNNYEFKIINKNGDVLWLDFSAAKIEWEGKPASIGTAYDITEIKNASKAIKESEEKIRTLIQLAPDAVFQGDEKGNFINANKMATQLTGYSEKELQSMNMKELFPKEQLSAHPLRFDLLNSGVSVKTERNILNKNDKLIPIEMHSKKMPDNTYLAFFRDISERKMSEEMLFSEKERLALTLKSIGEGVITTDVKGHITLINKAATFITGYNQEEALGLHLSQIALIIDSESEETFETLIQKINKSKDLIEHFFQTKLLNKNHKERIVDITGSKIKDKENNTIGIIFIFRDITEKHKLMHAAQKNQKLDALGILAGGIAHDFNNLLGSIFGYIDLSIRMSENPRIIKNLEKVMTTMDRAQNLTQQLLTFAKGGSPIKKIAPLISFIEETTTFALSGTNVVYEFKIDKKLWHSNYDKNQIAQVIDNIVINACHSMPMGGKITIKAKNTIVKNNDMENLPKGRYVKISVSDKGIGIQKEILPYIFDPFFTTKTKGHGLGLATCYSIIRQHNGEIIVDSEQGKGTTFSIYLPALNKTSVEKKLKTEIQPEGSGTVLIMDDDEILRETLKEILESLGYSVLVTTKGEDVLKIIKKRDLKIEPINLMIFDLTIQGGMGGKETIKKVRKINKDIPIIVASGYASDPIMANPEQFGFNDSISKPFRINTLGKVVKKNIFPHLN